MPIIINSAEIKRAGGWNAFKLQCLTQKARDFVIDCDDAFENLISRRACKLTTIILWLTEDVQDFVVTLRGHKQVSEENLDLLVRNFNVKRVYFQIDEKLILYYDKKIPSDSAFRPTKKRKDGPVDLLQEVVTPDNNLLAPPPKIAKTEEPTSASVVQLKDEIPDVSFSLPFVLLPADSFGTFTSEVSEFFSASSSSPSAIDSGVSDLDFSLEKRVFVLESEIADLEEYRFDLQQQADQLFNENNSLLSEVKQKQNVEAAYVRQEEFKLNKLEKVVGNSSYTFWGPSLVDRFEQLGTREYLMGHDLTLLETKVSILQEQQIELLQLKCGSSS